MNMNELLHRYLSNDPISADDMDTLNTVLHESPELRAHLLDLALYQGCLHELCTTEVEIQPAWWTSSAIYRAAAMLILALGLTLFWRTQKQPAPQELAQITTADTFFYPFTHFPFLSASPMDITLADSTNHYRLDLDNAHARHVAMIITPNAQLWYPNTQLTSSLP